MKKIKNLQMLTIIIGSVLSFSLTQADQIDDSSFTANASFESFEGLSVGENITTKVDRHDVLVPGSDGIPFTLPSGVTITGSFPNDANIINGQFIIADFTLFPLFLGTEIPGDDIQTGDDVLFGTAYLKDNKAEFIEITFPTDMLRVGIYALPGALDSNITLNVFDSSGNLIESAVSSNPVLLQDWGNNFLGIENVAGIRKIQLIHNTFALYDGLRFEGFLDTCDDNLIACNDDLATAETTIAEQEDTITQLEADLTSAQSTIAQLEEAILSGRSDIDICHYPSTNQESTIQVSLKQLRKHLKHGDFLGSCNP